MKKYLIIALTTQMIAVATISAQVDYYERVKKITPMSVFQELQIEMVRAFAGGSASELLKKGFDEKMLNNWITKVDAANRFVQEQVDAKAAPSIYSSFITQLTQTLNYIVSTVKQKEAVAAKLKSYESKMFAIYQTAWTTIRKSMPIPENWSAQVSRNPDDIMGSDQGIITQYQREKLRQSGDLRSFVTKLFPQDKAGTYLTKAGAFLTKLDKYIYRLKNLKEPSENISQLPACEELRNLIQSVYPRAKSSLDTLIFAQTTDKASVIIWTEASVYWNTLVQLQDALQL